MCLSTQRKAPELPRTLLPHTRVNKLALRPTLQPTQGDCRQASVACPRLGLVGIPPGVIAPAASLGGAGRSEPTKRIRRITVRSWKGDPLGYSKEEKNNERSRGPSPRGPHHHYYVQNTCSTDRLRPNQVGTALEQARPACAGASGPRLVGVAPD